MKRKFDELISHFNRKVSDMSIDQKYKMELLGMISAIGFAHEKELSTNSAEVGTDCISRQQAIDALEKWLHGLFGITEADGTATIFKTIRQLPPIQSEIVRCKDCKHRYVDGGNVRYNACELNHNNVQSDDWFCADGER